MLALSPTDEGYSTLDVQVKHLEDHNAELTVTLDAQRYQSAVQKTARRLSKSLRIPGFRPGKAPTHLVTSMIDPREMAGEVLEDIGNDIYREALEKSGIEPYSQADVKEVKLDEGLTVTFVFPKQPEVDLGNYRETLRIDFEKPEVTKEEIEDVLHSVIDQIALNEEVIDLTAQIDDKLSIDIKGMFTTPPKVEAAESGENEESKDIPDPDENKLIEENDWALILTDDAKKDFMPGFSAQLVGMSSHEEKNFKLAFPADFESDELAGREVEFTVYVNEVKSVIRPAFEDFAAVIATNGEVETLAEMRTKLQEELFRYKLKEHEEGYFEQIITQLHASATLTYPSIMVEEMIDDMVEDIKNSFKQRAADFDLDTFLKATSQTTEQFRDSIRANATQRLQRMLIMTEVTRQEGIHIHEEDIDEEIEKRIAFLEPDLRPYAKKVFVNDNMKREVANSILSERAVHQLIAVAQGLNPPKYVHTHDENHAHAESEKSSPSASEESPPAHAASVSETTEPPAEAE